MYVSTRDGKRFEKSFPDRVEKDEGMNRVQTYSTIQLNPEKVKQEIFGFGGAFTDAAAIQWMSARKTDRRLAKKLTKAYFSSGGLQYNMGRVPIASCDFSTRVYSYDDAPDDFQMTNFSLAKEDEFKRRFIKAAIEEIEKSTQKKAGLHQNVKGNDNSLWLFGSPWSAPAWMKQTKKMSGGGHLINSTQYWQAYALYFYKFFTTFDVPWWGMTIENEPDIATLDWSWQALQFSAEEMRDFLKNYLGPTLKKLPFDLKIMILDGGMSSLPSWADTIYNDPVATKFTSGAAIHWYGYTHACAKYLNDTNHNHPDKFILATEACAGWAEGDRGVKLGSWERAEDYADNIIMDLKNYVRGWVDWNLILDTNGGPNWAKNFVDAPILYNGTEFYKQSLYYALAHFSKFIPRGSTIIDASVKHPGNDSGLQVLTAMTPSNNLVSVILNKEDYQRYLREEEVILTIIATIQAISHICTICIRSIIDIIMQHHGPRFHSRFWGGSSSDDSGVSYDYSGYNQNYYNYYPGYQNTYYQYQQTYPNYYQYQTYPGYNYGNYYQRSNYVNYPQGYYNYG